MPLFSNLTLPNGKPSHLVWIQTSFLGDIVLTTGAIALARQRFPMAKQILVTTGIGKAVLADEPILDQVVVFEKKHAGAWAALRKVKAELSSLPREGTVVLQAHRSFRSSLLSRHLGYQVITYRQSNWSWLAHVKVERVACLHEAARLGLLLEPLGIARKDIVKLRPVLHPPAVPSEDSRPRIGLAPGSVWGTKRWPKEKYAELAAALLDTVDDAEVLLLGSEAEREQTDYIAGKLASPRLTNMAGKTSLSELKQLIASLDLLVANDSSPIHFASAFDTPTVAIFGSTVPQLGFGPLATRAHVAEIALDCRPCSDHGPQVCPLGHFRCMKEVSVERVLSLCEGLLRAPA